MRKANGRVLDSRICARIRDAHMSESDREHALKTMHTAERIADVLLWVKEKVAGFGTYLPRPSMKH